MSAQEPKVSVVVPVYNVEQYINQCLDSLIRQTLREIEIIVVDDGSPDNCPQIIDEYAEKDARIIAIHQINSGVSEARNEGITHIQGEYVFFCDSDDWLPEDALEVMVKKADETQSDLVMGDFCEAKGEKYTVKKIFDREFVTDDPAIISVLQNMVLPKGSTAFKTTKFEGGYCLGAPWHHIIRSEIIKKNNLVFDPYLKGMFDDGLFMLTVFENVKRVAYVSKVTYYYRVVNGSITHKFNPDILSRYQRVYERLDQFKSQYNKGSDYDQAVYIRIINYLNKSMEVYFMNSENTRSDAERYQEFSSLVKTNPYKQAISCVKTQNLYSRNTKILVSLLKLKLNRIYWELKKIATK